MTDTAGTTVKDTDTPNDTPTDTPNATSDTNKPETSQYPLIDPDKMRQLLDWSSH